MNHQKEIEIIEKTACLLKKYGYTVYLSANRRFGCYTDGKRVVSFRPSIIALHFSGNHEPRDYVGSGWVIATDAWYPTPHEAETYLKTDSPKWEIKVKGTPVYSTIESYLKRYATSGYRMI